MKQQLHVLTSKRKVTQFLEITAVLFVVSAAAYGQTQKFLQSDPVFYSTDLPGSDIMPPSPIPLAPPPPAAPGGISLDDRQNQCHDICASTTGCVAWTYVLPNTIQGSNGNCWLKNAVPTAKSASYSNSGTIFEQNTDRPGGDFAHFDNVNGVPVTAPLCAQSCLNTAQCVAWTFVKPGIQEQNGVCWLKNTMPAPVSNNACTSGTMGVVQLQ